MAKKFVKADKTVNETQKKKISGKTSRAKGSNYERFVAKKLEAVLDVEFARTPMSGGFQKRSEKADNFRGDILPVEKSIKLKLHIECKNQKNLRPKEWVYQAFSDCPEDRTPVVVAHFYNARQQPQDFVMLSLDDFLSIVPKENIVEVTDDE